MYEYFNIVKDFITIPDNSSIVEIASGHGLLYKNVISKSNISKYTGIEPNKLFINKFWDNVGQDNRVTIVNSTYEESRELFDNVDIVICAGLAYHLPYPTHLVEYLANTGVKELYFESFGELDSDVFNFDYKHWGSCSYTDEELNIVGNRQVGSRLTLPIAITTNINIYPHWFKMLGYKLDKYENINDTFSGKSKVCIMKFIKQ